MTAVVIVGGGEAGATTAGALRDQGFDGEIVLIGEEPMPPYERPPLSKEYLRGESAHHFVRPRSGTRTTTWMRGSASAPSA